MSMECGVESTRKTNIDYTINQKDEERCLNTEKTMLGNSLYVENSKIKREKSPSSCQNNGDETTSDNSRINSEKKNDNNLTPLSEGNEKRLRFCYDFKKGNCRRRFCRVNVTKTYGRFGIITDEFSLFLIIL